MGQNYLPPRRRIFQIPINNISTANPCCKAKTSKEIRYYAYYTGENHCFVQSFPGRSTHWAKNIIFFRHFSVFFSPCFHWRRFRWTLAGCVQPSGPSVAGIFRGSKFERTGLEILVLNPPQNRQGPTQMGGKLGEDGSQITNLHQFATCAYGLSN